MDDHQWIDGAIAVESVLLAASREVSAVYISRERYDGAAARIRRLAEQMGVPCSRVPAETIAEMAPGEKAADVVARAGPKRIVALDALLAVDGAANVMLDGVEDPFNFGQSVRSLYAAGIDGIILRPRNWLSGGATAIRASAGATEFMPAAVAEPAEAVAAARAAGIPVIVAATQDARPMAEVDLSGALLLIIGGERRGVAGSIQQQADFRVSIPYGREFPRSLGTAAAAAVLAFEIFRQRQGRV